MCFGCGVQGSGFRVLGSGFYGLGFRVEGSLLRPEVPLMLVASALGFKIRVGGLQLRSEGSGAQGVECSYYLQLSWRSRSFFMRQLRHVPLNPEP